MKASDRIKRGALEKTFNYFLKDPEHNIVKIMDLLEKVTPDNLFANQRKSFVMQLTIKTIGTNSL